MSEEINNEVKRMLTLVKKALELYVIQREEEMREEEEYELYKEQYPFEEYYSFKQEFCYYWV